MNSVKAVYTRLVALRSRHKIQRARFTNTVIADLGFIRETLMDDIQWMTLKEETI